MLLGLFILLMNFSVYRVCVIYSTALFCNQTKVIILTGAGYKFSK